ncbi:hypothetical protein [Nitrososphaera sp.]|uniref:hypothetical protein n=1 Tax=Nitrososphaera sp. TaxID=1971748 RepID=UPI0018129AD1|nr:hypothetical protein [Nitrososphaera sp.]NWG36682.1 hypothetical protein [Nitrososphaera sp.]
MIDIEFIIEILNSEVAVFGIIMGIVALLSKLVIPKTLPAIRKMLDRRQPKDSNIPESLGTLKVFIRKGDLIKESRGRILKDGSIAADGKTWVIEQIKPYLLTKGRNSRPAVFLDASKQIEYRFKDAAESNSSEKHEDIAGQATDPHLLKQFSDSIVIQKLAAAKPDKTMMYMMFVMGMFALMMLQQFIPKGGP